MSHEAKSKNGEEGEGSIPGMKELSSTSFGYLIAFLLPGLFGLFALTYWFPEIGVTLQPILKADTTVGPSAMLLLVALGTGLCIASARFFLLEKWLYGQHKLEAGLYSNLDAERLAVHRALAEEHYRYHQFYGGCFVAGLIWFSGWAKTNWASLHWKLAFPLIGFVLLEWLLERSAFDCYCKYVTKCKELKEPRAAGANA